MLTADIRDAVGTARRMTQSAIQKVAIGLKRHWIIYVLVALVGAAVGGVWILLSIPKQQVSLAARKMADIDLQGDSFRAGIALRLNSGSFFSAAPADSISLFFKPQQAIACIPRALGVTQIPAGQERYSFIHSLLASPRSLPRTLVEAGLRFPLIRLDGRAKVTLAPERARDGFQGNMFWSPKEATMEVYRSSFDRLLVSENSLAGFGMDEPRMVFEFSPSGGRHLGFAIQMNWRRRDDEWCEGLSTAVASQGLDSLVLFLGDTAQLGALRIDTLEFARSRAFRLNSPRDSLPMLQGLQADNFTHAHLVVTDSSFVSVAGAGPQPVEPITDPYFAEFRNLQDSSWISAQGLQVMGVERGRTNAVELFGYPEHAVIAGKQYGPDRRIREEPIALIAALVAGWFAAFTTVLGGIFRRY